jgi:hypothetical protein
MKEGTVNENEEVAVVLTKQEAFDRMVRGLRDQGWRKSTFPDGRCAYRGEGGLKCAIGHLIPDEKYTSNMDNAWSPYGVLCEVKISVEDQRPWSFLSDCQNAHDDAHNRLDMHQRLQAVAAEYSLTFPTDCIAPEVEGE